jgi:hypothetical protein
LAQGLAAHAQPLAKGFFRSYRFSDGPSAPGRQLLDLPRHARRSAVPVEAFATDERVELSGAMKICPVGK